MLPSINKLNNVEISIVGTETLLKFESSVQSLQFCLFARKMFLIGKMLRFISEGIN